MKTIYLIRHGEPDFPGGKRMCLGRTDLPLSSKGLKQAESAAQKLQDMDFEIFSSPLLRARQTAQAFHRPIHVLEALQELDAGQWDGLDFETIALRYPELYAKRALDKTIPPPDSERNESGLARFEAALTLACGQASGDFAIVGHGGIMALFLQKISGSWKKPGYGEIVTLEYDSGFYRLTEERNHA